MVGRGALMWPGGLVVVGLVLGRTLLGRQSAAWGEDRTSANGDKVAQGIEDALKQAAVQVADANARVKGAVAAQGQAEVDFRRQIAEAEQLRRELRDLAERYAARDVELRGTLAKVDDARGRLRKLDEQRRAEVSEHERRFRDLDQRRNRENAEHERRLRDHNQQRITENRRMQGLVDEANRLRLAERSYRAY